MWGLWVFFYFLNLKEQLLHLEVVATLENPPATELVKLFYMNHKGFALDNIMRFF